ncbi:hypothetical protein GGI43DRAFT_161187 [Trichoderma evansii]
MMLLSHHWMFWARTHAATSTHGVHARKDARGASQGSPEPVICCVNVMLWQNYWVLVSIQFIPSGMHAPPLPLRRRSNITPLARCSSLLPVHWRHPPDVSRDTL